MAIDWLAAGLNPGVATLFIQSRVPEHAELHLLLSMITPLGWLERVPSYKDQQTQLADRDLGTYGFLGYPLLQSADILLYRSQYVPVGEDQVAHVEITREIARRFNHIYGREPQFEQKAEKAIKSLGTRNSAMYRALRKEYQEKGDAEALAKARALVESNARLTVADRDRLFGYLEGTGIAILPEPEVLLTATPKVPGLDGRKMSKSYGNTIGLREDRGLGREEAQGHADRSGARAPHRSRRSRQVSGVGFAQSVFKRRHSGLGAARMPHRGHRLPGVQGAADREDGRGDRGHLQARSGVRGESGTGPRYHRRGMRTRARGGARDDGCGSSSHGHELPLTSCGEPMKPELTLVPNAPAKPPAAVPAQHRRRKCRLRWWRASPSPSCRVICTSRRRRSRCSSRPSRARSIMLLYLIRRQNLDILDIPIAEITRQYMRYIELMQVLQLELAGEYLLMAATLAEVKSRMLLPRRAHGRCRR